MKKIFLLLIFALAMAFGFGFIAILPQLRDETKIEAPETKTQQSPSKPKQNTATASSTEPSNAKLSQKQPANPNETIKSTKPEPVPALAKPQVSPDAAQPPQITFSLPPLKPRLSDQEIYSKFSAATIQILCSTREELFSASGAIVNQNGLVLTNAHVAKIVEKIGEANCRARHGSPADPFAKIRIIFVPDTIPKLPGNAKIYQRDFAFLKIIGPEEPFSIADIGLDVVEKNTSLLALGYPSEFLESVNTSSNSNLVFSALNVDGYADIDGDLTNAEGYVFNGGLILQQGSSGTALFNRAGEMVGIIFATTKESTTAERQGIALMTSYIDRILKLETGQGLMDFIASH